MVFKEPGVGNFSIARSKWTRKGNAVTLLQFLFSGSCLAKKSFAKSPLFFTVAKYSTVCLNQIEGTLEYGTDHPKESTESVEGCGHSQTLTRTVGKVGQVNQPASVEVFKRWGCDNEMISKLLSRRPSLQKVDVTQLDKKLSLLNCLGITSSDLVKVVNCRPRFLSSRINRFFDQRIEFLMTLFGSKEMLRKAIIRNPSLLTYDLHDKIKPVIAVYEGLGLSREDLGLMLISRPTLIPRTSFTDEKMEYICKTGVSKDSKMFKYVVSLIGVSRIETIREKVANIEKFGFSEEEVWRLFGKSPLVLTLSVDKVQRNMTYFVATMKLDARMVLNYPFLLYCNLDTHMRPRVLLAGKIEEMDLDPKIKGKELLTALRMQEKRFLKVYVSCHPEEVATELLEFYKKAKTIKPLAKESKKLVRKGFPF